jgi:hypothetical protein
MSTSPSPRPHRRVRSVPNAVSFRLTPLTTSASLFGSPTTQTPCNSSPPTEEPRRKRRATRSGTVSPHATYGAYQDHPSLQLKRSSSTFGVSTLGQRHDWTFRAGARFAAESLEEQGRSWLVSRASSTDLLALNEPENEEEMYHRYSRDLEIFDIGATYLEEEIEEEEEDGEGKSVNWWRWVRTFMEFGEETDDEIEWEIPRRKSVSFAAGTKNMDGSVVQRARERDEEHGLDGWMDGAAYLAFLGVRAFGGFF